MKSIPKFQLVDQFDLIMVPILFVDNAEFAQVHNYIDGVDAPNIHKDKDSSLQSIEIRRAYDDDTELGQLLYSLALEVGAKFLMIYDRTLALVDELDRILDRKDVVLAVLVGIVDNGGQGR